MALRPAVDNRATFHRTARRRTDRPPTARHHMENALPARRRMTSIHTARLLVRRPMTFAIDRGTAEDQAAPAEWLNLKSERRNEFSKYFHPNNAQSGAN